MDEKLIFAKTPLGEEAVRQRTRVVQRNLRMVLVQVDGNTSVGDLCAKIGNRVMVENALRELESGGFIAPTLEAASVWQQSKEAAKNLKSGVTSQFSSFGSRSSDPQSQMSRFSEGSLSSAFSSFGKPILPASTDSSGTSRWQHSKVPAPTAAASPVPAERPVRKASRFSLGALAGMSVLGLLLLFVGTLFVFPYDRYKAEAETEIGGFLKGPVKVGGISFQFLPKPSVVVRDIRADGEGDVRIAELRLPPPWVFLGSGPRSIGEAELVNATIPADRLSGLSGDATGTVPNTVLRHIRLNKVSIAARDVALKDLMGEVSFNPSGQLEKLVLDSPDRTLHIEGLPSKLGVALAIQSFGWRPAEDKPYVFDSMQVKGLLQKGKVVFQDIDTTFLGGVLKGSWLLDWSNGFVMAGDAAVSHLSAERVASALYPKIKVQGDMSGTVRLRGAGESWQAMWSNLQASADLDVIHGVLQGVDLGEAARQGGGRPILAGMTKFERLKGLLRVESNGAALSNNVDIEAGLMKAAGRFTLSPEGKVDGVFEVMIQGSGSALRIPVRVSGVPPSLQAVGGH